MVQFEIELKLHVLRFFFLKCFDFIEIFFFTTTYQFFCVAAFWSSWRRRFIICSGGPRCQSYGECFPKMDAEIHGLIRT